MLRVFDRALPCAQQRGLATDSWTIVDIKADQKAIFPFRVSENLSVRLAVTLRRTRSDEVKIYFGETVHCAPNRLMNY
jgi:hypothetical protein